MLASSQHTSDYAYCQNTGTPGGNQRPIRQSNARDSNIARPVKVLTESDRKQKEPRQKWSGKHVGSEDIFLMNRGYLVAVEPPGRATH